MQQFRLIDLAGATRRFSQNCCIKECNTEVSKESKRWSDFVEYILNRGYYMAARGYEFYLRVLKVSLTSERSERVRDTFSTRR